MQPKGYTYMDATRKLFYSERVKPGWQQKKKYVTIQINEFYFSSI